MSEDTRSPLEIALERPPGAPAAHLSLDADWATLTVIEFGSVWDGQPDELTAELAEDDRIGFLLREPDGPVVGFAVHDPHRVDVQAIEAPELWGHPRFSVPLLGLPAASVGEILLAVQARFDEDESTMDAIFFHQAIQAGHDGEAETAAEGCWRMSLEAGNMKGHFGLGYTLVALGRHRQAYDHLRIYTELTPHNAWAWCWLGRASQELGDTREAELAYRRALAEEREGWETNAEEYLAELGV